jgi:hypothetical protein
MDEMQKAFMSKVCTRWLDCCLNISLSYCVGNREKNAAGKCLRETSAGLPTGH